MDDLSALQMAKLVREKEVSSRELILDAFKRIDEKNEALNAVISQRQEKALQESEALVDQGQTFF